MNAGHRSQVDSDRRDGFCRIALAAAWLVAVATSCSDGAVGKDDAAADLVVPLFDGAVAAGDTGKPGATTDAHAAEVASDVVGSGDNCPGASGCSCSENGDCDTGLCIDTRAGSRCAALCVTDCVEAGFGCRPVSGPGGDVVNVCVPLHLHDCEPCDRRDDCVALGITKDEVVCADRGGEGGAFCASACGAGSGCPNGTHCAEVATREGGDAAPLVANACVPDADETGDPGACACSAHATKLQLATDCVASSVVDGKPVGCKGRRTCGPEGLSACDAKVAAGETCDGVDNDCDGQTDESSCDDDNPCTVDACAAAGGAGTCSHVVKDGDCDADGDVCTEGDACKDGACLAGTKKVCADDEPCTLSSCDPKSGCVSKPDDGKPCDDGNPCTTGDQCQAGTCTKGNPKVCVNTNACQLVACDQTTGGCVYLDKKDGDACDDGDPCTTADSCSAKFCVGSSVVCDDANACTTDACTPTVGCTFAPKAGACDDGNACTNANACVDGSCKGKAFDAQTNNVCDDGNACTNDSCSPQKGCASAPIEGPCSDGDACTQDDVCAQGACKGKQTCDVCQSDADCKDDGNPCNGVKFCDMGLTPAQCAVKPGSAVVCDASNNTACLANTCDTKSGNCTGLVAIAEGKSCDDGDACSSADACSKGACVGGKLDCDDANVCTVDACNAKTGCSHVAGGGACDDGDPCTEADACEAGSCKGKGAKVCDDGDPCTSDACIVGSGCKSTWQDSAPCSDGSACTTGDSCNQGACKGKPLDCDDGNACTADGCDAAKGCSHVDTKAGCDDGNACTSPDACANGACMPGAPVSCDDGNPCTVDSCDPKQGCVNTAKPGVCDDGDSCTKNDACLNGTCVGEGAKCDDGNPCTDDGCAPQGGCQYLPNSKPCDDGNPCTTADTCSASSCTSGPSKDCSGWDAAPCAVGVCVAGSCTTQPKGGSCSDGNACTAGDGCSGGKCAPGNPVACNDGNACTDDSCNPASGCVYAPNGNACNDGDPCTTNDACSGGSCQGGTAKNCSSLDGTCVKGVCSGGSCTTQATTGSCSDGDACTIGDACSGGSCQGGAAKNCNDNNPCTYDSCSGGTCGHSPTSGSCNDGNGCTTNDACSSGVCKGSGTLNCDDGNPCTDDSCSGGSCKHAWSIAGKACGTGLTCDGFGSCKQNCPSRPTMTVDGCTGTNYVKTCAKACEGCKSQNGFIGYNETGCGGATCFERYPNQGYSGFVVMFTQSSQTAYARWTFPQTLCGNYRIYASIPDPVAYGLPLGFCSGKWQFATGTYKLQGKSATKSVNFATQKSNSSDVLLFEGDLSGATGVTLGNGWTTYCYFMILDRIRAVPY